MLILVLPLLFLISLLNAANDLRWPSDVDPADPAVRAAMPLAANSTATLISRRCASASPTNSTTCCLETLDYLTFIAEWRSLFEGMTPELLISRSRKLPDRRMVTEWTGYHYSVSDYVGREDAFKIRMYWGDREGRKEAAGIDVVNVRCQWVRRPISCDLC